MSEKESSAGKPAEAPATPAPAASVAPPTPPAAAAPAPVATAARPNSDKLVIYLSQVPAWLWAASASSLVFFTGFLIFISQQVPDQFAMTTVPPWQHAMNPNELIAYHRALKSGAFYGNELEAKRYLYGYGNSTQSYAQQAHINTRVPQALTRNHPQKPLTIEDIAGYASRPQPVNQGSFRQPREYAVPERDPYGSMQARQIMSNTSASEGIYIQTASLRSIQDANSLTSELQNRGYSPFIQEAFISGSTWYRVRFGPYRDMADAQNAAQNLRASSYTAQVLQTP